jgi:hypothetical protein
VTPPPLNEYACEENDRNNKNITAPRRFAKTTSEYAQQVRNLAKELKQEGVDVALLDLWEVMMKQAGWKAGDSKLPGSRELPENMVLKLMLHDGISNLSKHLGKS